MSKPTKKALEGNLTKLIWQNILHRRIYIPVLAVYFMSLPDSTIAQVGYFMAAGSIAGFIFEVPSGYLSDKLGHKTGLLIAAAGFLLGTLTFLFGTSFGAFVAGSIFLAVGWAFVSGTRSAFIHDTLKALGRDAEYSQISAHISGSGHLVSAVLLVLIPATAGIDLRLPLVIGAVFDLIQLFVVSSLVAPEHSRTHVEEVSQTNFRSVLVEAHRRHFVPVLLFAGLVMALLMTVGSFRDIYQTTLGINVAYLGALMGASRAVAGLTSRYFGGLREHLTMKQFYLAETCVLVLFLLGIGITTNVWVVSTLFIVLVGLFWGSRPLAESYELDLIATSKFKATLLSLTGLAQYLFKAGLLVLLGFWIAEYGFSSSFVFFAIVSAVSLGVLWLLVSVRVPDRESEAAAVSIKATA